MPRPTVPPPSAAPPARRAPLFSVGPSLLALLALGACGGDPEKAAGAGDGDCTATTFYRDVDGDGFGDAAGPYEACTAPEGHVDNALDCDDVDAAVHPEAAESCNGTDDDCDGEVDEGTAGDTPWYADGDGDGYGDPEDVLEACTAPAGRVDNGLDCDDADAAVNPAAADLPRDGTDSDCSGSDATSLATAPLAGDLTVTTVADAEAFCADHDAVLGDLRITGGLRDTSALSCLVEVHGDLLVTSDSLAAVALPALWWVGGDLSIVGNPSLSQLELDALRIVDGELSLLDNAVLAPPTLGALALVGTLDSVDRATLPALATVLGPVALRPGLTLPSLAEVGGNLSVGDPDQTTVSLPALHTVTGGVYLLGLPALETLSLPALETTSALVMEYLPDDLPVELPALDHVGGAFTTLGDGPSRLSAAVTAVDGPLLLGAHATTAVSLPALATLGDRAALAGDALAEVDLTALETAPEGLSVACEGCAAVGLDALVSVDGSGLALTGFGGATALGLGALQSVSGPLVLSGFGALVDAELPRLVSLDGPLELVALPALARVSLPALSALEDRMEIGANPALVSVSLPVLGLPAFASMLDLRDNPLLESAELGLSGPQTGALVVSGNATLASLDLSGLETIGDLRIVGELDSLDLSALAAATGELELRTGPLASLSLPALTTVGDGATLVGGFTSLDLTALAAVGGDLALTPDALASLDLSALETVGGPLSLGAGGALGTVALPALTQAGLLVIEGTEGLTGISAPLLSTLGSDLVVSANFDLRDLDGLSALTTVGGSLVIVDNAELNDVSGLSGVGSVGADVFIQRNPSLAQSAAQSLVADDIGLGNIGGTVAVTDNGT